MSALREASGLAVSRRAPGRLWSHNDSGQPVLVAFDANGTVTATLQVTGARVDDWEAIGSGPCDGGACLFVGDIGDNNATRAQISVYRVPEPADSAQAAATSDVFHATYPDGAHDAETLLVAPDGGLFVVTKGATGPIALYRFPRALQAGTSVKLERVGAPQPAGKGDTLITDGAISPDGAWVVLRTKRALLFYQAKEFLAGTWREAGRLDLTGLKEPQGEGVAFGPDRTIFLAGEGARAGSFGRLACGAAK